MAEIASSSFAAVSHRSAERLILGSLPGTRSLHASQYYAQPRNAFWRIMGELYDAGPDRPYAERLSRLVEHRLALWDVVASGVRPGSLDSSIDRASVVGNDFATFFAAHPAIHVVFFNGRTAADLYRLKVLPGLPAEAAGIETRILPSTSPAYAAMSFEQKLAKWSSALAAGSGTAAVRRAQGIVAGT